MTQIPFVLLLLSTCLPPMQGLTDEVLMPKWYGVGMVGLVMLAVYLTLPIREGKIHKGRYVSSNFQIAAIAVLTYHLIYALITDIIMTGSAVIKGVFDNPTGFALHTCMLVAMIEANRPSSRPPSMGEAFIEITGRRTIRQVSIILVCQLS